MDKLGRAANPCVVPASDMSLLPGTKKDHCNPPTFVVLELVLHEVWLIFPRCKDGLCSLTQSRYKAHIRYTIRSHVSDQKLED